MNLFDVYPIFDIQPTKAKDVYIWDSIGRKYLDFYGGHAVISIGHKHPHYVDKISEQLNQIGFYSNAVQIPLQMELAEKLGDISGYSDYNLFLCNTGAEANENAIKLASFYNDKKKIISFNKSFHGRTSAAVAVTDNPAIQAPVNKTENVIFLPLNDMQAFEEAIKKEDICAVIVEGIQGIGGINVADALFLAKISDLCNQNEIILIVDEIQSGYGRTGKFFAHQHANIKPDLITVAKGMGNGFPIAAVLINPKFEAKHGLLGTTFGGNHLACAAGIAVLDVIEEENLVENALNVGNYFLKKLHEFDDLITDIRGMGLMIGLEFEYPVKEIREKFLFEQNIFTGASSNKNVLRLLPPLTVKERHIDEFIDSLSEILE